jgi:putative hemolysin
MKLTAGLVVAGTLFLLTACSSHDDDELYSDEPVQQATSVNPSHSLNRANPASANCGLVGGTLALARQLDGSTIGMCQLPDGKQCEEWALMRGACPAG